MKNIFIKTIAVVLLFLALKAQGQTKLLKQGSIVITHSPGSNCLTPPTTPDSSSNASVVSILDASNTANINENAVGSNSTVKNRFVWTAITPGNHKPNWVTSKGTNKWTVKNLGRVFGITLDSLGNIYVANSSIYQGEVSTYNHDKIWRIDNTTGAMTAIWTAPSSPSPNNKGLGNLKFFKYANKNFIAVSSWEDGIIYFITESSTGVWTNAGSFDPTFNLPNQNDSVFPYGVAVRQSASGLELFYGELNIKTKWLHATNFYPVLSKRIFSVSLTYGSGIISPSGLESVVLPMNTHTNPESPNNNTSSIPVSDISFSADYSKMITAQQTLDYDLHISAHSSEVLEYEYKCIGGVCTWQQATLFPTGFHSDTYYDGTNGNYNTAGGITYWNNTLFANADSVTPKCDVSVLYSSDIMYLGNYTIIQTPPASTTTSNANYLPPLVEINSNFSSVDKAPTIYGIMGLPSKYTPPTPLNHPILDAFNASLKIDADDYYGNCDKYNLGDVEAFNEPLACPIPCTCSQKWNKIDITTTTAVTTIWNGSPQQPIQPLVYTQGQPIEGVLYPSYACSDISCHAKYKYILVDSATGVSNTLVAGGGVDSNLVDFRNVQNKVYFQSLVCTKSYYILIKPKCGGDSCGNIKIPLYIKCPPVCQCKGAVTIPDISANKIIINPQNNGTTANTVSTVSGSFILTASQPITEVRMLVDEFRIRANPENINCMLCKSKPETWASFNSNISISNTTPAVSGTSITPALSNDVREYIFSNGANTYFKLNNSTINFSLDVPGVTNLNCCTLKADVCIKFIIRDVDCCEREVLKCFTFDLK